MQMLSPPESDPPRNASGAAVTSLVVSAKPCRLFGFSFHNPNAAVRYVQLHDATALPANTTVPLATFQVPIGLSIKIDFGAYGRQFAIGCVIASSTTAPTLTVGSAEHVIDAQFKNGQ